MSIVHKPWDSHHSRSFNVTPGNKTAVLEMISNKIGCQFWSSTYLSRLDQHVELWTTALSRIRSIWTYLLIHDSDLVLHICNRERGQAISVWGFGNCWCIHVIVWRPAATLGSQIYSVTEDPNGMESGIKEYGTGPTGYLETRASMWTKQLHAQWHFRCRQNFLRTHVIRQLAPGIKRSSSGARHRTSGIEISVRIGSGEEHTVSVRKQAAFSCRTSTFNTSVADETALSRLRSQSPQVVSVGILEGSEQPFEVCLTVLNGKTERIREEHNHYKPRRQLYPGCLSSWVSSAAKQVQSLHVHCLPRIITCSLVVG
jgi:hypothetical protein